MVFTCMLLIWVQIPPPLIAVSTHAKFLSYNFESQFKQKCADAKYRCISSSNLFYIILFREETKAEYLITVVTGNKEGAGTDSSASLVIKGTGIILLVFTVTPLKVKIKTVQQLRFKIWKTKGSEDGKILAKIQVGALVSYSRYSEECSTYIYKALYGSAMFVPF